MSDFRELPQVQYPVEPGDFATARTEDAAAIRARNRDCTPTHVWHFDDKFAGVAGGETGV